MKRIDIANVKNNVVNMAMLEDTENTFFYDVNQLGLIKNNDLQHILTANVKFKVKATKENKDDVAAELVNMLEKLNTAFCRAVNAPESMRVFKVLEMTSRYTGNETAEVLLKVASFDAGNGALALDCLIDRMISKDFWGTEGIVSVRNNAYISKDTFGMGNALRSWKSVMNRYGVDIAPTPAVLYLNV